MKMHPLLPFLVIYSLGIWIGKILEVTIPPVFLVCLFLLGSFLFLRRTPGVLVVLLLLALGVGIQRTHFSDQRTLPTEMIAIEKAQVMSYPTRNDSGFTLNVKLDRTASIARLFFPITEVVPQKGEWIEFRAKLHAPRNFGNEYEFNHELFAKARRIHFYGTIDQRSNWKRVGAASEYQVILNQFRDRAIDRADLFLDPPFNALFKSFVLGDQSEIDTEMREVFRKTGIMHVLVVSGFHVAFVAVLFGWLAGFLYSKCTSLSEFYSVGYARAAGALLGAGLFCSLTNFQIPTLRAFFAFLLAGVALGLRRFVDLRTLLLLSLFLLLIFQPLYLFDVSTQLSFAAVAGIGLALSLSKRRTWLSSFLAATIGAFVATLPVLIAHFHTFSAYAILGNLIFVPILGTGAMAIALASLFLSGFLEPIGNYFLCVFGQILEYVLPIMRWLASLPLSDIFVPLPSYVSFLGFLIVLGVTTIALAKRNFARVHMLCMVGGVLLLLAPYILEDAPTSEAHFIHVGQGDSAVIHSDRQGVIIIDTGPGGIHSFDAGERIVHPWLTSHGIRKIDLLVLTHSDQDHIGGALTLIDRIPIEEIWVPRLDSSDVWKALSEKAMRKGIHWKEVDAKTPLKIVGNTRLQVFHPSENYQSPENDDNNRSIVLQVEMEGRRMLLTGDIEADAERFLISRNVLNPVDFLKVAHHGSRTSSTPEFLKRVSPEFSIINAGYKNRFGHPANQTLERLNQSQTTVLRGDFCGEIAIRNFDERKDVSSVKKCHLPL